MKSLLRLTFCLWIASFSANAQFEIDSFVQRDSFDSQSTFPIIKSEENPKAAERVNIVLHHHMLEKVYKEKDFERFINVFPEDGEFHGAADFEYDVIANNGRYFSISITCSYTGAYTEYHTQYFNFDAKTGQPIFLSDMFSETVLSDIGSWVNESIYERIYAFMNNIDTEDPEGYGQEQYGMYEECASWYKDADDLSEEYYFLTDSTVTFVKGRCSNHMMAALDDLWEFYEEYTIAELYSMMSDNGMALMEGLPLSYDGYPLPEGKILEGKIGGIYPVTMILSNLYHDEYQGVYWYNKVKKPISVIGGTNEFAFLTMNESVDGELTGTMELQVMLGGTLEGHWLNADGSKKLKMKVSIAE